MAEEKKFELKLLYTVLSVFAVSVILASHAALARPTVAPPGGTPPYPPGTRGPTGPGGNQGNQGSFGQQGNTGPQGNQGGPGYTSCDWGGSLWLSHGYDGGGAWGSGIYISCSGGVVTSFSKQNGLWACTPRGCGYGPP